MNTIPTPTKDAPFYTFTLSADATNTSRGADQILLYTAAFGASTNTNEYGFEITVEDDVVVRCGGNDTPIPSNGFVLSLHGAPMQALRTVIVKGMLITYDPATLQVTFTFSADGLKRSVDRALDAAKDAIGRANAAFVYTDHEAAQAALDALYRRAAALTVSEDLAFVDACNALIAEADQLCRTQCDSYPVHYRGVWIRPSQKNAAEVEAYIKTLHDKRINFVSVEGWFENGVIMTPPEGSLFGRHRAFDYDVLQAYVEACHKYGMECHLWMPIMNLGDAHGADYETNTVPGQRPDWLSLSNRGTPDNHCGFMMIDPANKEARAYLTAFYQYVVTTYDIDAFEMDYIRYFACTDELDFGYTKAAFDGFEEAYGYGVTPTYDRHAPYWEDWCRYRRRCVREWAEELRAMIDREAPHVLLSADVAFPFSHALHCVYQDFPSWLEDGLLDLLHPMAYGDGYEADIRKAVALAGDRCMVVTGLGAQGDLLRTEELERQTRENTAFGAYGDCFFEADAYFYKHLPPAVKQAAYRRDAITPFRDADAAIRTMLAYMRDHVTQSILPLGGVTEAERRALEAALDRASAAVADSRIAPDAYASLKATVDALGNANATAALRKDLRRIEHITCVRYRVSADTL